jgi:GWxTD domain-containing protein
MNAWWFRLVPACLVLLTGQALASKPSIIIALDGVAIPLGPDSTRIELLAGIASGAVGSNGPLLVSIRLRDNQGHTLAEMERVEPASSDTTGDRLLVWTFPGKPGKLQARVRLKTLDDLEAQGEAQFEMNVPEFSKEGFLVSTPWLGTVAPDSVRDALGGRFRPLPSRIFRSQTRDLALRLVLFEPTPSHGAPDSCRVRCTFRRGSQKTTDTTFVQAVSAGGTEIVIREDPRRLPGGQYKFQITLTRTQGFVEREGAFQVAAGGDDLLRDPVLVRTVLGYIATGEERWRLENAPADSLPSLWTRFWQRRDPSPGTPSNEALERFLYRVSQATNRFGSVVPGWRSDRGRIFIQHGDPKRTERIFDPTTRTDTEIWYYEDRNLSYVFQDVDGFGNYRLTGGQ